jgi:hypothetical protein
MTFIQGHARLVMVDGVSIKEFVDEASERAIVE